MRLLLDSEKLRQGLLVRGLGVTELALISGLSCPTVAGALAGRRINMSSAVRLARALNSRPVISELAELVPAMVAPAEPQV